MKVRTEPRASSALHRPAEGDGAADAAAAFAALLGAAASPTARDAREATGGRSGSGLRGRAAGPTDAPRSDESSRRARTGRRAASTDPGGAGASTTGAGATRDPSGSGPQAREPRSGSATGAPSTGSADADPPGGHVPDAASGAEPGIGSGAGSGTDPAPVAPNPGAPASVSPNPGGSASVAPNPGGSASASGAVETGPTTAGHPADGDAPGNAGATPPAPRAAPPAAPRAAPPTAPSTAPAPGRTPAAISGPVPRANLRPTSSSVAEAEHPGGGPGPEAVDEVPSPGRAVPAPPPAAPDAAAPVPGAEAAPVPLTPAQPAEGPSAAAPAAPAPPTAAAPDAAVQISSALATLRSRDGSHELVVHLDPPELGAVHLRVQLRHGVVNVVLAPESSAARAAVEESLPRLRHDLESAGLRTGQVEVQDRGRFFSGESGGHGPTDSGGRSAHRPGAGTDHAATTRTPDHDPEPAHPHAPPVSTAAGSLDLVL